MNNETNELFSVMSSWNSFVTPTSPSFICNDDFNSDPTSDTVSDNNNSFKKILGRGFLESTRPQHESNFPASQTSRGVQVTKTVKYKTCALDNETCALDNRFSPYEGGPELASACFNAAFVKAEKNNPEKADRSLEKESTRSSKC